MDENGILTALPGSTDLDTGNLRVTAFVTPRLDAGGGRVRLADYPGFADWGSASAHTHLELEVDAAGLHEVFELIPDPASPKPDEALWRLLFERVMVGDGHFQDLSGDTVASFPSAAVAELVRTIYATVAETSPTALPPATAGPLKALHPIGQNLLHGREQGERHPAASLPTASPPPGAPPGTRGRYVDRDALPAPTSDAGSVQTITEAIRFYDRPGAADPLGPDVVPPPPDRPDLEYHAFVSALADYPVLLRHLGLALDLLIVGGDRIPQGTGRVRFLPREVPVEWMRREEARPWTWYEIQDRRFIALPRDREDELADGSLRLEATRLFHVEQIDLDGAALKVANTARTVVAAAQVVADKPGSEKVAPSMTPDAASLPALRGSGLTLYRKSRARKIVGGWDAAAEQDQRRAHGEPPDLFAEDVTRGYRLDIAEESNPEAWSSLHARTGAYSLRTDTPGERLPLPLARPIEPDEGYLKAASASRNAAEPKVAYLHEAVAGWEGWSLAAPRPGNRIGEERVENPEIPAAEKPGFELPLFVEFRPTRGSLPSLRFGRTYRMRARLVDMAGRSVPPEFLEPTHVSPFSPFYRWDPVPSPAVVPRRPFTEGESLLRMVIRSTLGVSADDYAALARITGLPGHVRGDLAYRSRNERHVVAPIGSQQLAELHGKFNDAVREGSSPAQRDEQFKVATLSSGSLLSAADAGALTDGKAPPRAIELELDDFGRLIPHANLQQQGEYVLHDVDTLTLPYLPDPLAAGVSFTTLPGDGGTRVQDWPSDGAWYDRKPILLRIEEGTGAPAWEPGERLLTVFLPKAEHASVHLSSVLPKEELGLMGVWMLEGEPARQAQEEDAVLGRHWMLTPWSVLDLVHAVEKPLAPPVIHVAEPPTYNSAVHRFPAETFASLNGTITTHARSTGRLDVDAEWTEPIDDVTKPAIQVLQSQSHVGDFLLDATEDDCRVGRTEYAPTPGRPATHLLRHEFGDTKHRWVEYKATATTRFREYFPPEVTDHVIGGDLTIHEGPTQRLNVPSSHRPDPPQVEYIVPTWTWEERTVVGARAPLGAAFGRLLPTTVHTRVGGGLRVYLSRPWYSSGDDELLGVVVREQPWLTLPIDRAAGLLVAPEALQAADAAAERIFADGLASGRAAARLRPTERLLSAIGTGAALRAAVLPRRLPAEDAQLTAHLAALEGVGDDERITAAARGAGLTGILDLVVGGLVGAAGPFVTRWGTDPAWASQPTARGPYIHQFPLRSAVGTGISLLGQTEPAVVVGHAPVFDETRGLWYCDLQLEAGAAYQPFVDLALVRYQPCSIAGHHASGVVRPGFIQLVPDRTAALTPLLGSSAVAVSLRGPSGYNALGANFLFGSPDAAIADASRQVVAQVQVRPVGGDAIDWAPLGGETRLHASGDSLADIRWHATVPVPAHPEGTEARLVLSEFELFESDASQAETWVDRPVGGFGEAARKPAGRRLVFATEFAL